MRLRHNRKHRFLGLATIGITLLGCVLFARHVWAGTNQLPNSDNSSGGNSVFMEITIANGTSNTLDAPISVAKLYFKPFSSNHTITFSDACHHLYDAGRGAVEPDSDPRFQYPSSTFFGSNWTWDDNCNMELGRRMIVDFYVLDANGNWTSPGPNASVEGQAMGMGDYTLDLGIQPYTRSNLSGYDEVMMVAHFLDNGASSGFINAFRTTNNSPGGLAGYGANTDFALQRRLGRSHPSAIFDESYTLSFAPPCNTTGSSTQMVSWRDADAAADGGIPADNDISMHLQRQNKVTGAVEDVPITINQTIYYDVYPIGYYPNGYIDSNIAPHAVGGNGFGSDRQAVFTVDANWRYIWTWTGFEENNGLWARMPYDSSLSDVTCETSIAVDNSGASLCSNITGWAYDRFNRAPLLRIDVYVDSTPGSVPPGAYSRPLQPYWTGNAYVGAAPDGVLPTNGSPPAPPGGTYRVMDRPDVPAAYGEPDIGRYHGFYINDPAYVAYMSTPGTHTVRVYAIAATPGVANTEVVRANITCPSTTGISCSGATVTGPTGGIAEPGEVFGVTVGFMPSAPNGPPASFTYTITIDSGIPGAPVGSGLQTYTSGASPPPTFTANNLTQATAGVYTVAWTVAISGQNTPCTGTYTVARKPYFKVHGGDVSAGAGFGANCDVNADAGVIAFNKNSNYAGAGTQVAVFALGQILGFATSQVSPTAAPKALAFANSGSGNASSTYGGDLDVSNAACVPNYFAEATGTQTGNVVIAGRNLAAGSPRQTIYVDGNAFITGNITYSGSYANISQIPSFRLIVRGNIFVDPSVSQLSGLFVAQPSLVSPNDTGRFYTCGSQAWASGSPQFVPNGSDINASCATNQLTVYGAVVADRIKLMRARGTLSQSTTTERYNTAYPAGQGPAETFIFSPESWLGGNISSHDDTYDTINILPPIL
jgi:hypothetical protein